MIGWISIHRQLCDKKIWLSEPFTRGQAWVDLLMLTNYENGFIRVRGVRHEVKRGQVGWSEIRLAKRWKWSRGKVRRFFQELEEIEQQIVQEKNNITTLISIVNYEKYQNCNTANGTTSSTTNGQQTVQQTDTNNKNNKNNKKNKENIYAEFVLLVNDQTQKKYKGCERSRKQFNARIKEGRCLKDFESAIKNAVADPFHIKEKFKYLTPEFFTRQDKLDKFINAKIQEPPPSKNNSHADWF